MKPKNSTLWRGRTCAILAAFAAILAVATVTAAFAGKGGKPPPPPPPPPPPTATHHLIELGTMPGGPTQWGGDVSDLNDAGIVVGASGAIVGPGQLNDHPYLLQPKLVNGTWAWFQDADGDGANDLMTDLGVLTGFPDQPLGGIAYMLNNRGCVVGSWWHRGAPELYGNDRIHPFLIVPQDLNGDGQPEWFADANADGCNDLMLDLGAVPLGFPRGTETVTDENGQQITIYLDEAEAVAISEAGYVIGHCHGAGNVHMNWFSEGFLIKPFDQNGDGTADTWFVPDAADALGNALMLRLPGVFPVDVNDRGEVVGTTNPGGKPILITPADTDGDGSPDTWFRDANGDSVNDLMTVLPLLTNGTAASAAKITQDGQAIAGECYTRASAKASALLHAVLWRVDAQGRVTVQDLGSIGTEANATANDLNDSLQVVGAGWTRTPDRKTGGWTVTVTPFLWQNGVMTDLRLLLDNSAAYRGVNTDALRINAGGAILGRTDTAPYIAVPLSWMNP